MAFNGVTNIIKNKAKNTKKKTLYRTILLNDILTLILEARTHYVERKLFENISSILRIRAIIALQCHICILLGLAKKNNITSS